MPAPPHRVVYIDFWQHAHTHTHMYVSVLPLALESNLSGCPYPSPIILLGHSLRMGFGRMGLGRGYEG